MNRPQINKVQRNIKEYDFDNVLSEYAPQDDDIMTKERPEISNLKHIIYDELTTAERNIILLYASEGTIRKVAKQLHVSPSTAFIEIHRIQKIIKDKLTN